MTKEEAVETLNALTHDDPESAHAEADEILTAFVPDAVRDAWLRACDRAGFWYA